MWPGSPPVVTCKSLPSLVTNSLCSCMESLFFIYLFIVLLHCFMCVEWSRRLARGLLGHLEYGATKKAIALILRNDCKEQNSRGEHRDAFKCYTLQKHTHTHSLTILSTPVSGVVQYTHTRDNNNWKPWVAAWRALYYLENQSGWIIYRIRTIFVYLYLTACRPLIVSLGEPIGSAVFCNKL